MLLDLLGQVLGEAQGTTAAWHDRDLQQRVGVLEIPEGPTASQPHTNNNLCITT